MSNSSISNSYNPIEDLFNTASSSQIEMHQSSVETSKDYDPIGDLFQTNTNDEALATSLTQISQDFKSIASDTPSESLFFPSDVIDYDLFNIKPAPDLKAAHDNFTPLLEVESKSVQPQFKAFTSNVSNARLQEIVEKFDQIDLHILTPASLEKLKQIEAQGGVPEELVADKELELDIQKVNVRRNPEQVAWAVQNNAFVGLGLGKIIKSQTINIKTGKAESAALDVEAKSSASKAPENEDSTELKMDARWAKFVNSHNVRKINVYDDEGKLQREIHHGDFHVVEFTASEIEFVSRLAFAAIHASIQLRQIEEEKISKKEEINGTQKYQNSLLESNVRKLSNEAEKTSNNIASSTSIDPRKYVDTESQSIKQGVRRAEEDRKEQQELKDQLDKKDKIIKQETEKFEQNQNEIKRENKSVGIKKDIRRNVNVSETAKKEQINRGKKEKVKVGSNPEAPPIDIIDNTKEKRPA